MSEEKTVGYIFNKINDLAKIKDDELAEIKNEIIKGLIDMAESLDLIDLDYARKLRDLRYHTYIKLLNELFD